MISVETNSTGEARSPQQLPPAETKSEETVRFRADQLLRQSEKLFRAVFEQAPIGIALIDSLSGRFQLVNRRYARIAGYSEEELLQLDFQTITHPEDLQKDLDLMQSMLEGTNPGFQMEKRYLRRSGEVVWVALSCVPLWEGKEGPKVHLAMIEDITDRKQSEEALRQSEERHRKLFTELVGGAALHEILCDGEGNAVDYITLEVNHSFEVLLQVSREQVIGKKASLFLSPEELRRWLDIFGPVALSGNSTHYEVFSPKNRKYFEGTVYSPEKGKFATTFFDVTERKRTEEALWENEERLRLATASSNTGLWDWNLITNQVYYSPIWKRQIGYEDHEIPNLFREWESRVHPDDLQPTWAKLKDFIARPYIDFEVEFRFRHKDGSFRWIMSHASILCDKSGNACRMLGSHIDITERKQAEEALRQLSQRLRKAYDTERRRIARDLHDSTAQQLAAVTLSLGMLEDRLPLNDPQSARLYRDCCSLIERCTEEVRTLSYLLHPPLLDQLGLSDALYAYAEGFSRRSGIPVEIHMQGEIGRYPDDLELALFRVVQEGLGNIHRHSGGKNAQIHLKKRKDWLILEVCDDGKGIPAAVVQAFRRESPSFGLGLVSMKERMKEAGGTMEIASGSGGTVLRARIPVPRHEP